MEKEEHMSNTAPWRMTSLSRDGLKGTFQLVNRYSGYLAPAVIVQVELKNNKHSHMPE